MRLITSAVIVMGLCGFIFYSGTGTTPPTAKTCSVIVIANSSIVIADNAFFVSPGC